MRCRVMLWAVVTLAVLPMVALAQGEAELKRLAERARTEKGDPLRDDLLAFLRKHPGTPSAVTAAGLLRDLPSPLDKLDAKAIPELERFPWHPKETVAVVGEHRGRQGGAVTCVLFAKSGKWLASGSTNGLVRIWDPATMRLKKTLGHGAGAYCLAISKDSSLLVTGGGDGQAHRWNMTGDEPKDMGLLKVASTPLLGVALAPNGKALAAGGSDTRVYLWDLAADPPKETSGGSGHTGPVHAVVYSPSGKLIASGSADKTVRVWSVTAENRMKDRASADAQAAVLALAFHPTDDKVLVSGGGDGVIRVWEVGAKLTQKSAIKTKNGAVNAIGFSASGKTLIAGFGDGSARTWTFGATLTEKSHLEGHKMAVTAVAFSQDGTHVATGGSDWTVRLWPGAAGLKPKDRTISHGHLSHVYAVAFSPDGKTLASGSYDATARFWDLSGSEPKERVSKMKEEGAIYTLAFAPDGKTLVCGGATAMFRTCDVAGGHFQLGFKGHAGQISRLDWSADGKQIASCSNDKTLRLWDPQTGKGLSSITTFDAPVNSVAFSPDGKQLLCSSGTYLYDKLGVIVTKGGETYFNDSTVRLYETAGQKELAKWKYDKALMGSVAFTPDGRTLLAGGSDGLVRQWDAVKLPTAHEVFYKAAPGVGVLACSPDGRWLASYTDYQVQIFDLATKKKVRGWSTGEQFGHLAWAPDSRHLAISLGTGVTLVLRLEALKQ